MAGSSQDAGKLFLSGKMDASKEAATLAKLQIVAPPKYIENSSRTVVDLCRCCHTNNVAR